MNRIDPTRFTLLGLAVLVVALVCVGDRVRPDEG